MSGLPRLPTLLRHQEAAKNPISSKPRNETTYAQNTVSDPITDQEMAFAHLVLSGTMNDRRAAEAVGLNPDSAAYTKSKPRVRAYMRRPEAVKLPNPNTVEDIGSFIFRVIPVWSGFAPVLLVRPLKV